MTATRTATLERRTNETAVRVALTLDGHGTSDLNTGIGFFDHMLALFARHGGFDLAVHCEGDLNVDGHHTVEDVGIALGAALAKALGDKRGLARYGSMLLPMDEALALVALDLSGRPYLVCDTPPLAPMIGGFDSELAPEFLRAFATHAGLTLHAKVLYGANSHHMLEALFKALGHALRLAATRTGRDGVLSTKGTL